jgi:3D (Asp-Asp-Asp) domain-containing protein
MTQALNLALLANNVNSSGQLLGTAVSGAVANATNATNSNALIAANFSVFQSGSKLFFQYNGVSIASLDSSGNFIAIGTIASGATP